MPLHLKQVAEFRDVLILETDRKTHMYFKSETAILDFTLSDSETSRSVIFSNQFLCLRNDLEKS